MNPPTCNLCGRRESTLVLPGRAGTEFEGNYRITHHRAGENFPLVRCAGCGLIFSWPRPKPDLLAHYYASFNDSAYEAEAESRQEIARRQLRWLKNLGAPEGKRLLEIGAATGIFLAEAKGQGYEVSGIELSDWGRKIAQEKYGLTLLDHPLENENFPDSSFDVVCLFDVLEHLDDPRAMMTEIARILTPGGAVVLLTPDIGHWRARMMGARWWGIQQAHLFYFSRATLSKMLESVGLRVVGFGAGPRVFTLVYWAQQLRGYNRPLGALAGALFRGGLGRRKIGMNFPDHMMVLARKP